MFAQQKWIVTIKLWMHENGVFLVPVKYTLVCCAPPLTVHGHMRQCLDNVRGGFPEI